MIRVTYRGKPAGKHVLCCDDVPSSESELDKELEQVAERVRASEEAFAFVTGIGHAFGVGNPLVAAAISGAVAFVMNELADGRLIVTEDMSAPSAVAEVERLLGLGGSDGSSEGKS